MRCLTLKHPWPWAVVCLGKTIENRRWRPPPAAVGEKGGPNQAFGAGGIPLPTQAVAFPSSLPAPPISTDGPKSSPPARSLNPLFVEWLMGWPLGWTACAVSETEWCRYRRLMRTAFSGLLSRMSEAEAGQQMELF